MTAKETIQSRIWREEAEQDNPFAAARCYCHGYDVFGEVLGKAGWVEYLYLLFAGERPRESQRRLLENLAVAIANPGPRDHSVIAAMNGGVGGSNNAACLMAALAVGAGQLGGAREVAITMAIWRDCGTDADAWRRCLLDPPRQTRVDVWPEMEHPPGFDPHGASCPTPVRQTLEYLASISPGPALTWLNAHRDSLESIADAPLAMTGVAAAAFHDLELDPAQGEMLFLMLRLPGAAVHALEQNELGFRKFPFFLNSIHLENDPGPYRASPETRGQETS